MEQWRPEDIYILAILASNPSDSYPRRKKGIFKNQTKAINESTIALKNINYYMISYAVLIYRLAKFYGIPKDHVNIFARGIKDDFNIKRIIGEKLYIQLDYDEIYETELIEDLNLVYFDENSIVNIKRHLIYKENAKILYFIDDLKINHFLQIFLPILYRPHSSLRMFNNSCHSATMIDIINLYFSFSKAVMGTVGTDDIDIKMVKTITKFISSVGYDCYIKQKIHDTAANEADFKNPKNHEVVKTICIIKTLVSNKIDGFFDDSNQQKIVCLSCLQQFCAMDKLFSEFQGNSASLMDIIKYPNLGGWYFNSPEYSLKVFIDAGLETLNDFYLFHKAFCSYRDYYRKDDSIKASHLLSVINSENISIVEKMMSELNCNNTDELYNIISQLEMQDIGRVMGSKLGETNLLPHNDHMIVTSANQYGESVTFGTRRIPGTNVKVILGSPAFGAFINEVFFNISNKPIDVQNITKAVVGSEEEGFLEYTDRIQSKWTRLDIQKIEFGSLSNERFFSNELLEEKPTKRELMERIGFKLTQVFDDDGETPLDKTNKMFVERTKRERIRRSRKRLEYNPYQIEIDEYYSEDEVIMQSSGSKGFDSVSSESDSESGRKKAIFTEKEATRIMDKLNIPNSSWALDSYLFIMKALEKKTRKMDHPFNPKKEGPLQSLYYDWALNCMRKGIPMCQISNAHTLISRISDFLYENKIDDDTDLKDEMRELLTEICKTGNSCIKERHEERRKLIISK